MALLADPAPLAQKLGAEVDNQDLLDAIADASAAFIAAVGHPVIKVVGDHIWLDGDGARSLLLPAAPVLNAPVVTVDGIAVTDFEWSRKGILRRTCGYCWPDRLGCIEVTYDHGYDPIPDDIQAVVRAAAEGIYSGLTAGVGILQVGGETVTAGAGASVPGSAAAGVTTAWVNTVEEYQLNHGDRA